MSDIIPIQVQTAPPLPKSEPFVSVIMPIRNEAAYIRRSLNAVLSQDYPAQSMEVIVVDGMSTDQTREIVRQMQSRHPNLYLLDNPGLIVPTGLNAALEVARGDVLIRVDGHCVIATDYVSRCVRHLQEEKVDCVGGPITTVGESYVSRAIALAMSSPFGVGGSAFRTVKDRAIMVDTVAFPAYTRQAIATAGRFDEELVRNQDDEYNYRLRKVGGKILLSPDIHAIYYSRSSLKSLWRQYFQYGYWKVRVMQKHPAQMSLRQFVPSGFILALLASALAATFSTSGQYALGGVTGSYLLANLVASLLGAVRNGWRYLPLLPIIFSILHLSYGLGFLAGIWRFAVLGKPGQKDAPDQSGLAATVSAFFAFLRAHLAHPGGAPSLGKLLDNAIRRFFDILVSLLGLIFFSPLFLLLAVLIKRNSPGPVLYRGKRAGKDGRIFEILKFRTMYENPASHKGPRVTAQDDPRITPLGRILRDSKLNELPQLWNVLVGDMSLVGPRPEDADIAAQWPADVRQEILSVRPGITSPASVVYRNEETMLQAGNVMGMYLKEILPSKLRLDQLYVRNRSILTDLDVLLWTFLLLMPRFKQVTVPEHLLYWGPLSLFIDRYLTWFLVDLIVAFGAIGTAGVIWRIGAPLDLGVEKATGIALVISFLFSLINSLMGLNHVNWKRSGTTAALELAISSGLVTGLLFVANLFWPGEPLLPPSMLLVAGTFAFIGFVTVRFRSRLFMEVFLSRFRFGGRLSSLGERVLIVGSGDLGLAAARLLRTGNLAQAFNIIGMVDDDPRKIGQRVDGCKVIGETRSIPALVKKYDVGLILFSISKIDPAEQARILADCQATSARIMMMPEVLDLLQALFPRSKAEGDRLMEKLLFNAGTDRVTGFYNRNQFLRLMRQELPRARRYGHPFSIVMLSIELASQENTVTAATSVRVIKDIAERIRQNTRVVDILGRFDTNEFAIALPETDYPGARLMAERIIKCTGEMPIQVGQVSLTVKMRAGVATASQETNDVESLLNTARSASSVVV